MKRVTTLAAALLGAALLAGAPPAAPRSAAAAASPSAPAAYRYYVACGLSESAKPSHRCRRRQPKGAFFRSNLADVFYRVCVRFPTGASRCAPPKKAEKGILYVNRITSNILGRHTVTWFVARKQVGAFNFTVYR